MEFMEVPCGSLLKDLPTLKRNLYQVNHIGAVGVNMQCCILCEVKSNLMAFQWEPWVCQVTKSMLEYAAVLLGFVQRPVGSPGHTRPVGPWGRAGVLFRCTDYSSTTTTTVASGHFSYNFSSLKAKIILVCFCFFCLAWFGSRSIWWMHSFIYIYVYFELENVPVLCV